MAGPVYHTSLYPKESRYPDYYNGKLFIYDWIRNWVKVVTMLPNGDFDKMEPFMANTSFASTIDMEVGPDGKIYILEYGKGWFSQNPDAAISRIDYFAGELPRGVKRGAAEVKQEQEGDGSFKDLDKAGADLGHKEGTDTPKGKSLILASDCESCHKEVEASIGPSYKDIAKRYNESPNALNDLAQKIIKGGGGVWGEVSMPAHPAMKETDAKEIVKWILSL
jgi:cytochrome c551/c552